MSSISLSFILTFLSSVWIAPVFASATPCHSETKHACENCDREGDQAILLQWTHGVDLLQGNIRVEHTSSQMDEVAGAGASGDLESSVDTPRRPKFEAFNTYMVALLGTSSSLLDAKTPSGFPVLILAGLALFVFTGLLIAKVMRPQSNAVNVIALCVVYNAISATMIETNKWLMQPGHFPYPLTMTANHMLTSFFLANVFRMCCPSAYPALENIEVTAGFLSKFLPIGCMFATSIVCGNAAYQYLSVPFLQVMKQCNVATIYAFSVICGLDALRKCSIKLLAITLIGTTLTVHGELQFQLTGFLLQIGSSVSEAAKVVTQGLLMSGSTKLDPLSMVLFMAPACLFALVVPLCISDAYRAAEILQQFKAHSVMIIANASCAFALNCVVAQCIKSLSPTGYIMMGVLKDVFIVTTSAIVLGESLTLQQTCGFAIALTGVAGYSLFRQTIDCFVEDELIPGFWRVYQRLHAPAHEGKGCPDPGDAKQQIEKQAKRETGK